MWSSLVIMMATLPLVLSRYVLEPGAFLKLPDANRRYVFNSGTANKAAYDPHWKFLYVIGYRADVLHVVDLRDPNNPQLLDTKAFDKVNQGLPDSIAVCRYGLNNEFLAIAFESSGGLERAHVHLFALLDPQTVSNPLQRVKDIATTESFDPRAIAWNSECSELVVASEGDAHERHGVFEDPPADIEFLIPSFGTTIDRRKLPIDESKLAAARIRHVFQHCDNGTAEHSTRVQDLEPKAIHVDKNDVAYILFQENNAIARLDLKDPIGELSYHDLHRKDWSQYGIGLDAAFEDNGIILRSRKLQSFYQPGDLVSFELDGKIWLATADTGAIRRYALPTCQFDESATGRNWNQPFADGLTEVEAARLSAELRNYTQLGRLRVSKLKTATDGWDAYLEGYDFVSTFGGRGFSILNSQTFERVYDSGDSFERYFLTADAREQAMFNGNVGPAAEPQSVYFDRASAEFGPTPSAIKTANFTDTQVLVIANGVVGGLYVYSVRSGLHVQFESYIRRGQPGLSWTASYERQDDSVGEPRITDLVLIEEPGYKLVVAVSSTAGALSFYHLREGP